MSQEPEEGTAIGVAPPPPRPAPSSSRAHPPPPATSLAPPPTSLVPPAARRASPPPRLAQYPRASSVSVAPVSIPAGSAPMQWVTPPANSPPPSGHGLPSGVMVGSAF